jgi:hypothetical protein
MGLFPSIYGSIYCNVNLNKIGAENIATVGRLSIFKRESDFAKVSGLWSPYLYRKSFFF